MLYYCLQWRHFHCLSYFPKIRLFSHLKKRQKYIPRYTWIWGMAGNSQMANSLWDHFRKFVFPVAVWWWRRVKWHFHCIVFSKIIIQHAFFPRRTSSPLVARHWEAVTIICALPGTDPKAAPVLLSKCTSNKIALLGLFPKINPAPQQDYTLMNNTPERKPCFDIVCGITIY